VRPALRPPRFATPAVRCPAAALPAEVCGRATPPETPLQKAASGEWMRVASETARPAAKGGVR
jgi:hypothetical protein